MTALTEVFVQVRPDMTTFGPDMTRKLRKIDASKPGAAVGRSFGTGFSSSLKGVLAGASALFVVDKVRDFFTTTIAEAREAQKVGALTAQVIKTTGGVANVSAAQVESLATALSIKAGVDDELIQSGANLLLTFKNVRNEAGEGANVFDRATAAALDLSSAGFGDMTATSKILGKALNDPLRGITALGRAGVTFTQQQKDQIKAMVESGDVLAAQKIILGEVESQVGGAAAASATAGEKISVTWNNLKESAGKLLLPVLDKLFGVLGGGISWLTTTGIPGFLGFAKAVGEKVSPVVSAIGGFIRDDVVPALKDFGGWITGTAVPAVKDLAAWIGDNLLPTLKDFGVWVRDNVLPVVKDLALWIGDKVAVVFKTWTTFISENIGWLKPMAGVILAIVAAVKIWHGAQLLLNLALSANPIGLVVIAIGALVTALLWAWQNSETFRDIVIGVWEAVRDTAVAAFDIVVGAVRFVIDWVKANWPLLLAILTGPIGLAVLAIVTHWDTIKAATQLVWDFIVGAWNGIRDGIVGAWNWVWTNAIQPLISGFQSAWDMAIAVRDGVVGAWNWMAEKLGQVYRWIRDSVVNPIVGLFGGIAEAVGGVFEGIVGVIKSALNLVFGFINSFMIKPLNFVLSPFFKDDTPIPPIPLIAMHSGGMVPGVEETPRMLLGGEAVLNRNAVQALGPDTIKAMNEGRMKLPNAETLKAMNSGEAFGGLEWPDWLSFDNVQKGLAFFGSALNLSTPGGAGTIAANPNGPLANGLKPAVGAAVKFAMDKLDPLRSNRPKMAWDPVIGIAQMLGEKVAEWAEAGHKALDDAGFATSGFGEMGGGKRGGGIPDMTGGIAFPLPRGSYRVGRGTAGHGYAAQDWPVPTGTRVFSPIAGRFTPVRLGNRSYGNYANVVAGPWRFILAHLSGFARSAGMVKMGETLGFSGSTGNSTGPHLHGEGKRNGRGVEPRSIWKYDSGGYLPNGVSLAVKDVRGPERVLNPAETRDYERGRRGGDFHYEVNVQATTEDLVRTIENRLQYARLAHQRVLGG